MLLIENRALATQRRRSELGGFKNVPLPVQCTGSNCFPPRQHIEISAQDLLMFFVAFDHLFDEKLNVG